VVGRFSALLGTNLLIRFGLVALGTGGILLIWLNDSMSGLVAVALVSGMGTGVAVGCIPNLVVRYTPAEDQASIAGSVQIVQTGFSSAAPILMFAILAGYVTGSDSTSYAEQGYQWSAALTASFAGLALVLAILGVNRRWPSVKS
jgi:hypothetical protein